MEPQHANGVYSIILSTFFSCCWFFILIGTWIYETWKMQGGKAQAADKRKQVRKVIKVLVNLCLFFTRQLELLKGNFNWAAKGWFFLRGGGSCTPATVKTCHWPLHEKESHVRVKHKLIWHCTLLEDFGNYVILSLN